MRRKQIEQIKSASKILDKFLVGFGNELQY